MWNVYRKFTKSMLRLKRTGDKSARMFCHLTTYSIFGLNTSCTDSFQLKSLPVVPGRLLMWKFYRKDCWSQTSFNRSSIKTQERRRAETFGEDYFYFSVRLLSSIRHISANDRRGAQNINQCIGQSQRGYTHTHTHTPSRLQSNQTGCDVTRASTQRATVRRICVDPTRATFSHRTPSRRHVCSFLSVDSCVSVSGNTHRSTGQQTHLHDNAFVPPTSRMTSAQHQRRATVWWTQKKRNQTNKTEDFDVSDAERSPASSAFI